MGILEENLKRLKEDKEDALWNVDAEEYDPKYKGWIIRYSFRTGDREFFLAFLKSITTGQRSLYS